ncbi:MAG: glycosyltransferase family 2 protein [Actinomycetota bacterium]|nr:glycosyltransferase family 2 protein [Actinomycetota bacterium]
MFDFGLNGVLVALFLVTQCLYLLSLTIDFYFYTRPIDLVDANPIDGASLREYPKIILLYPVLRESDATMRTTLSALATLDYPADRFRIVAVPNSSDASTIYLLQELQQEFGFLEILEVPPTSDKSWDLVWSAWETNSKAYWWHKGRRAFQRDLPPKKTRQLIYAFYTLAREETSDDWLLNYIDADSAPPADHFLAGATGMQRFDVVQSTNIAGNLLDTWPASWHAMDHLSWDGHRYPHLSANGRHPYWVLGKGVFYRASDLLEIGAFNPWITIEDPEVGMRLWVNGKRLGIITNPLIEEVPATLRLGIIQRKRWVCGFLQSLNSPLKQMGMTFSQRLRARMNFWPCLFLLINPVGLPVGAWAFVSAAGGDLPWWVLPLGIVNVTAFTWSMGLTYRATWTQTARVLDTRRDRLRYMIRVNPLVLWLYWLVWTVPLLIGIQMYLRDKGHVWERTAKVDANHDLVASLLVSVAAASSRARGTALPDGEPVARELEVPDQG